MSPQKPKNLADIFENPQSVTKTDDSFLEEEFRQPYMEWQKNPNPETTTNLLKTIDPVIEKGLMTYAGGDASPTLRSRAKIIALNAIKNYDPQKAKLRSHLMINLQQLQRERGKDTRIVQAPPQVLIELSHVERASKELEDKLGRPPSDKEIAQSVGISPKRLAYIRKIVNPVAEGRMETQTTEDGNSLFNPAVVSKENPHWVEFVYGDLDPTDQFIMEHTLGLHNKPILKKIEIAKRLKMTPAAVSQRLAKIQQRLDSRYDVASGLFS